ncbi:MAG: acyl-CoA dehydrogenase family protein [Gammaproteobacteria bacterium]|nr:acyl-CoA dehydrogenase family protein [Gammaproteobacteria bacterium]
MNTALAFTDDQAMILDGAREFCRAKSPIEKVRSLLDSETGFDPAVWQEMVDLGWPALAIPEEHGGAGLDIGTTVPLAESMGRTLLSTPFFSVTLVAQGLLRAGTPEQQARWLPELVAGRIATLALLDDGDWGAPTSTCTATRDGDASPSGRAQVASSPMPAWPRPSSSGAPSTAPMRWCGWTGKPSVPMPSATTSSSTRPGAPRRSTWPARPSPPMQLLDPAKTTAALRDLKLLGAMLTAAEATGSTAACLDVIVDYLKTRRQFGQLIGAYQSLKHPTVDILNAMDSARSLVYHAATVVGDGSLDEDAETACRMAKVEAGDALLFAGDRAVQFHGAMGFTHECDAQLFIRRGQWMRQWFGDPAQHRRRLARAAARRSPAGWRARRSSRSAARV